MPRPSDIQKDIIAIAVANGAPTRVVAEQSGLTIDQIRRLKKSPEFQSKVAAQQKRNEQFYPYFQARIQGLGIKSLNNYDEFLDSEDVKLRYQASRDVLNASESMVRRDRDTDAPTGLHIDAETAKNLADAVRGMQEMSNNLPRSIKDSPHFVSGREAVKAQIVDVTTARDPERSE